MFVQSETWTSSNRLTESWVLDVTNVLRSSILLSWCVNFLHCFVEPLLCWAATRYATMLSHLGLLSESRRLVDTHFLPSPYPFLAPKTEVNAQSTPALFAAHCDTPQQLLDLCQSSNIKTIVARTRQIWATVPLASDCFVEPPHCDTLIVLSHWFTILSQCATMLSPSRFAESPALAMPLVI